MITFLSHGEGRKLNYHVVDVTFQNVAAVLSHGIIKEDSVPPIEIDRAIQRRKNFEMNPNVRMYEE